MATNRKPDPPAGGPPPSAPDPTFDGPPKGREPGDDQEEEAPQPQRKPLMPEVATNGAFVGPAQSQTGLARRTVMGEEIEFGRESALLGAQIKAEISARTIHALQHPRSFDESRARILQDCLRPAFAKVAIYRKPVGNSFVEGLSIRAAEAMLMHWGNFSSDSIVIDDTPTKRVVRIYVVDLETNGRHGRDITIPKETETLTLKPGQEALSQRINSQGKITYLVRPTEDKLADIEANHRSKVLRNEGLRLIPPDIKEEALALCRKTRGDKDAEDPDSARKEVQDAFRRELGIMPGKLEEFLGCPVQEASPAQIGELRDVFRAIKDGDATFKDFMEARVSDIAPADGDEAPKNGSSRVEKLKQEAREKAAARKAVKK